MADVSFRILSELEAAIAEIAKSPRDNGVLELIVRRPKTNVREVLDEAELTLADGLVGDRWKAPKDLNNDEHLENQLTIINSRVIEVITANKKRWPLAGDQLYLDMNLSLANLSPGTKLVLGSAVIEVTELPHTPCRKFADRFGSDAAKFVNSPVGRTLHLRGIHAKVVEAGTIRVGDVVKKCDGQLDS